LLHLLLRWAACRLLQQLLRQPSLLHPVLQVQALLLCHKGLPPCLRCLLLSMTPSSTRCCI
jgi:hypothetical protein